MKHTLMVAGVGLLLLGSATMGLAMADPDAPGLAQGFVWLGVGALLLVFSRLAPPPTSPV